MKQLFILLITFISLTVQGQKVKPTQRIFIGYNFSSDYCFRTLKSNGGTSSSNLVIKNRNDIELAKFGYTTGLNVFINFTKQVALETGTQFSNKGYRTRNHDLIYFPPNPNEPTKTKTTYSYQYIGVPLEVKYTIGRSKLRFLLSVGFMTNFLLNVKQTTIYEYSEGRTEEKTTSITTGFKKVDVSPMVGLGVDYKINDIWCLIGQPTFRYGIISTIDAPVTETLWNAGINIGFYCRLK